MTDAKFTLGRPAADIYKAQARERDAVLNEARKMANLTIPSVFPPDGWKPGEELEDPEQGIGADCVSTLASKLMYVALPPSRIAATYVVKEYAARADKALGDDPDTFISKLYMGTAALEEEHRKRIEASPLRDMYQRCMLEDIIGGNTLADMRTLDGSIAHNMSKYVVKRDARGRQIFVILEEKALVEDFPDEIKTKIEAKRTTAEHGSKPDKDEWNDTVTIHTVCYRNPSSDSTKPTWLLWQEYEGDLLTGSTEETAAGKQPQLYAHWMVPHYGSDWGLSYCDAFRSDFLLIEDQHRGLREGLKGAVEYHRFVKPSTSTKLKAIQDARNGAWLAGDAADLSATPPIGRTGDLNFAITVAEATEKRLGRAFLKRTSIQRSGERVTAEEWQQLGQEMDESTGGLHTKLSQSIQRYVLIRAIELHLEEDKTLPDIVKVGSGYVELGVATGIDALGRSHEGDQLVQALTEAQTLLPQSYEAKVNADEFMRRVLTARGVRVRGLVVSDEEIASKQEAQQQNQMAQDAAPGVAKEAAGALFGGMKDQALMEQTQPQT